MRIVRNCNVTIKHVVQKYAGENQAQLSTLLYFEPKSGHIQKAIDYANAHLRNPLTAEEPADVAG